MIKHVSRTPASLSQGAQQERPSAVLIVMHGYGADENDLISIAVDAAPDFLVISLQAPIALPWGGYAWYHLEQTAGGLLPDDLSRHQSEELVMGSLRALIEKCGGDLSDVTFLGFSQGAAMCYSIVTRHRLADYGITVRALVAISGYIPRDILSEIQHKDFKGLPVFISHGEFDDLIPVQALDEARDIFERNGASVFAKVYPVGHGVLPETVADLKEWIAKVRSLPRPAIS